MDNLTHTLTGIVMARAGLDKFVPRAAWLLAFASNAPDLDIVTGLAGTLPYLHHHRGWTHAFAFSPIVALAALAPWWLMNRRERFSRGKWLAAWGVASFGVIGHHLMDWLNVYGIRLLLPFRADWFRLDLVFIVDAWVWAALLMALAAPALARLVYGEIGYKAGPGRGWAWFAIIALTCYFGLRWETHARAVAHLDSRIYGGETPSRVAAAPHPFNPFYWTGLVETASAFHMVEVDLARPFDPRNGEIYHKPAGGETADAVRRTGTYKGFMEFAQWPVWRMVPSARGMGAMEVTIHDIRFGRPDEMRFTARFLVMPGGRVEREEFLFGPVAGGKP